MNQAPTPYAGSNIAKPDGWNEGVDYALEVVRERIRYWERRRRGPFVDSDLAVSIGMDETELVALKQRILANRRAGT